MHKDIPVIDIEIDRETKVIAGIGTMRDKAHLPPGVFHEDTVERGWLNQWWVLRSIPASRDGIRKALEILNRENTGELAVEGLGLSLSDHYWIRPEKSGLGWEDVNFYVHEFSEDIGDALFGEKPKNGKINFSSPDVASNGNLKKKWKIVRGKRVLVKGGSGPYFQEPVNEAVASMLLRRLDIPHVEYCLYFEENRPYSLCENFTDERREFIGAWDIFNTVKENRQHSELEHYLECCKRLGVPGVKEGLEKTLAFDFLIANSDRHYYNFGAMRDSRTLEWLGPAPVFDCGNSLWYQSADHMIKPGLDMESKPFRSYHSEQIKLVKDLGWFHEDNLYRCDEECEKILSESAFISKARRDAICLALKERIKMLENIALKKSVLRDGDGKTVTVCQGKKHDREDDLSR
jgi:hypothetical protein